MTVVEPPITLAPVILGKARVYNTQMEIKFLYYEKCPSHGAALERLRQVMAEEGVQAPVTVIKVESPDQAERLQFIGSPTILVNGEDIDWPLPDAQYALACRAYRLEDGRISPLPSAEMIRRALRGVTRPTS